MPNFLFGKFLKYSLVHISKRTIYKTLILKGSMWYLCYRKQTKFKRIYTFASVCDIGDVDDLGEPDQFDDIEIDEWVDMTRILYD